MKALSYAILFCFLGSVNSSKADEVKEVKTLRILPGETEYTTDTGPQKLGVREKEGICYLTL